MGITAGRMTLAPLTRREAWWLARHIRSMDRVLARYVGDDPVRGKEVEDMRDGFERGREALARYRRRPWPARWIKTPPPACHETRMRTWLEHMAAHSRTELADIDARRGALASEDARQGE
jgi:hypothetical protein